MSSYRSQHLRQLHSFPTRRSSDLEAAISATTVIRMLIQEILGGIGLGLLAGYLCYRGFKTLDEPNLEILMTVATVFRSEEHTSELQSQSNLVCRLLL